MLLNHRTRDHDGTRCAVDGGRKLLLGNPRSRPSRGSWAGGCRENMAVVEKRWLQCLLRRGALSVQIQGVFFIHPKHGVPRCGFRVDQGCSHALLHAPGLAGLIPSLPEPTIGVSVSTIPGRLTQAQSSRQLNSFGRPVSWDTHGLGARCNCGLRGSSPELEWRRAYATRVSGALYHRDLGLCCRSRQSRGSASSSAAR